MNIQKLIDVVKFFWGDSDYKMAKYLVATGVTTIAGGGIFSSVLTSVIGFVLIVPGIYIAVVRFRGKNYNINPKGVAIVIEHKGLEGPVAFSLKKELSDCLVGYKFELVEIDQTGQFDNGRVIDPGRALRKMINLADEVNLISKRYSPDIVKQVVYGGLAPVPFVFVAGNKISSKQSSCLMDYNRFEQKWHALGDHPNGHFFSFSELPMGDYGELSLVLCASCSMSEGQIRQVYPEGPIVWGRLSEIRHDSLDSIYDQKQCLDQVLRVLTSFSTSCHGLSFINLFVAAQASFVFLLGQYYDLRLYPNVRVYQFERNIVPCYPWAVELGHASDPRVVGPSGEAYVGLPPLNVV